MVRWVVTVPSSQVSYEKKQSTLSSKHGRGGGTQGILTAMRRSTQRNPSLVWRTEGQDQSDTNYCVLEPYETILYRQVRSLLVLNIYDKFLLIRTPCMKYHDSIGNSLECLDHIATYRDAQWGRYLTGVYLSGICEICAHLYRVGSV